MVNSLYSAVWISFWVTTLPRLSELMVGPMLFISRSLRAYLSTCISKIAHFSLGRNLSYIISKGTLELLSIWNSIECFSMSSNPLSNWLLLIESINKCNYLYWQNRLCITSRFILSMRDCYSVFGMLVWGIIRLCCEDSLVIFAGAESLNITTQKELCSDKKNR